MRWIVISVALVVVSTVLQFALDIPDVIWDESVRAAMALISGLFSFVAGVETQASSCPSCLKIREQKNGGE